VLLLVFLSSLAKYIPYVVIASLLLVVAWNLIDLKQIRHEIHMGPNAWIPMVVTGIGTITIPLEWAILGGILTSVVVKHFFKKH
jgi:SulP family sulfate permease